MFAYYLESKWKQILISIESAADYFLEFSAFFLINDYISYIAIDDIEISSAERCQELNCSFDNDDCQQNIIGSKILTKSIWFREKYGFIHRSNPYFITLFNKLKYFYFILI